VVHPLPVVNLDSVPPVCISAPSFELNGSPSGGIFSGTGVTDSIFNPTLAGAGSFKVKYNYTSPLGCASSDSITIVVHPLPVVSLDSVPSMFNTDPPVELNGTPSGGIFSGTGVTDSIFNPAIAGIGIFSVVYFYSDFNGCQNSDTIEIIVNDNPIKTLSINVLLEGPFNETEMNILLNSSGLIPLAQPYSSAPWNYAGTENLTALPNSDVIDWVLVELRDAAQASQANSSTRVSRQAALLLKDGRVVGLDGSSPLQFNNTLNHQLFVVIWHRNHLAVLSAYPLILSVGNYSYDFSTSESTVFGGMDGHKQIFTGVWGMIGGDANADGTINVMDIETVWKPDAGKSGYKSGDFNMNIEIDNTDKNDLWYPNLNKISQVPN
jgi:hypothetical protein